jgi:hypothetical protein
VWFGTFKSATFLRHLPNGVLIIIIIIILILVVFAELSFRTSVVGRRSHSRLERHLVVFRLEL